MTIGELLVEINGDNSGLKKTITESMKAFGSIQDVAKDFIRQIGLVAVAWKAVDLTIQGINYNKAAEQAEIAFGSFLGSASAAKDMIEQLRDLAKETPLEFAEVRDAAKQMSAFGIEAGKIIPTMRMLSDVSAGLGIPIKDLAYLFGTIKTQGKAMTIDLMQFANRGIPIWDELAKVTGKSGTELRKMVEAGQIGFPQINQAFQNMTSEGGKFFNMAVKQMDSLAGAQSNLNDNFDIFLGRITEGMSGPLKSFSNGLSSLLGTFVSLDKQLNAQGTNIWAGVFDPIAILKAQTAIKNTTKNVVDYADRIGYANSLQSEAVDTFNKIKTEQKAIADKAKELADLEKARIATNETLKQQSIAFTGSYVNIIDSARRLRDQEIENAKVQDDAQAKEETGRQIVLGYQNAELTNRQRGIDLEKQYQDELKKIAEVWKTTVDTLNYASDQFASLSQSAAKFGNADLSKILSSISQMAKDAGNFMGALAKGDYIAATISGIALIADAWDSFFNKDEKREESRKKKKKQEEKDRLDAIQKEAEAAEKAEKERLEAVDKLDSEYQDKFLSQIGRLQKERDERVAYARKIGADVFQIEAYYAGEIEKVRRTTADISVEAGKVDQAKAAIKQKYAALLAAEIAGINSNVETLRAAAIAANKKMVEAEQIGTKFAHIDAAAEAANLAAFQAFVGAYNSAASDIAAAQSALDAQMNKELGEVLYNLQLFQDRAQSASEGIGKSLSDGLKQGISAADFRTTIMDMLRNMAIDAAIIASGFQEQFSAIGVMIAEAMKDGFDSTELDTIGASIDALYAKATAAIAPINDLFANRITPPSVPSNVTPFSAAGVPTGASPGSPAAVSGGITLNIQSNAPLDPKQTADANLAMLQAAAFQGVI